MKRVKGIIFSTIILVSIALGFFRSDAYASSLSNEVLDKAELQEVGGELVFINKKFLGENFDFKSYEVIKFKDCLFENSKIGCGPQILLSFINSTFKNCTIDCGNKKDAPKKLYIANSFLSGSLLKTRPFGITDLSAITTFDGNCDLTFNPDSLVVIDGEVKVYKSKFNFAGGLICFKRGSEYKYSAGVTTGRGFFRGFGPIMLNISWQELCQAWNTTMLEFNLCHFYPGGSYGLFWNEGRGKKWLDECTFKKPAP